MPTRRANDVAPTWISSSHEISRSTGRRAARRRARPPSPRRASRGPCETSQPPQASAAATGSDVGELGGREPDRPQEERAPLGAVGVAQVGVDPPHALLAQAERLERAAALDRLADRAGERRVRGALPEVARPARASGTSACRTKSTGTPTMHGRAASGLTQIAAATVSTAVIAAISRLRHGEADRARQRVDVGGRPRDQVAGAGALDRRERQREHAAHEVLAQLGEHLLGEHERGAPREQGQRSSARRGRREHEDDLVDVRVVVPSLHRLRRAPPRIGGPARPVAAAAACSATDAEQRRRCRRASRLRLQRAARRRPRSAADRSQRPHLASRSRGSRVVRGRSSRCVPSATARPSCDEDDAVGAVEHERARR